LGERDLRGLSHYEVFPEIPERWRDLHRRALAGEVLRADEDPFERADGRVQWLRWEIRPWYEGAGEVAGIVAFSEDTTERKLSEMAQREAERHKHEFLATLAHELRNPLAPIRNALEIMKFPDAPAATMQRARDIVDRQVGHLVRLVDDLLDASRLTRGKPGTGRPASDSGIRGGGRAAPCRCRRTAPDASIAVGGDRARRRSGAPRADLRQPAR
jgi:signal transduction histidine kinase